MPAFSPASGRFARLIDLLDVDSHAKMGHVQSGRAERLAELESRLARALARPAASAAAAGDDHF